MSARKDGRKSSELRPVQLQVGSAPFAEGSCLIRAGRTQVFCTASVQEGVPSWRSAAGGGWVTAEYGMLPRSTPVRTPREQGKGRVQEIQRLIGRSLRAVVDLDALGPRTVIVDCDVLQADGGTRTASVTGAAVALAQALQGLVKRGELTRNPMRELVAAVSVGIWKGTAVLDLDYAEDSEAQVDMNLVATERGDLVEIQGTAEGRAFTRRELEGLVELGMGGIGRIVAIQKEALEW